MWNLPPPPGFQGLREDLPLECRVRNLPHWRQEGATYFVTIRLADSMPQIKRDELQQIRAEWLLRHPEPISPKDLDGLAEILFEASEGWLDEGYGECLLKHPDAAQVMAGSLHHFDGERYELGCYVVMPNHVHVIVRPTQPNEFSLDRILTSWKTYTAVQINELLVRTGERFWQPEGYDRIIRDEAHLWRTIQYIGRNPKKARLPDGRQPLWIRPEWERLGWRFELAP